MKKYTNFRIIYLNLNLIYICLSIYVFYKCAFNKMSLTSATTKHKSSLLAIVATIQALVSGYIGCSAIWFRSKSWTQIQMLINVLFIPFLVMAYVLARARVDHNNEQKDELCEYAMIGLFTLGISLIPIGYKYVDVLRKEMATETTADSSNTPPIHLRSLPTRRSSALIPGIYVSGSYPSPFESNWNLVPFGRLNTIQMAEGVNSLATVCPSINLIVTPNQLDIYKSNDKVNETQV